MPKTVKSAMLVPLALAFVFLLSVLPLLLQPGTDGSALSLRFSLGWDNLRSYFTGIGSGETFRFLSGKNELDFWEQIVGYFRVSLFYVAGGALIGTTIGILMGIYFSLSRAQWLKRGVELLGALPDFVLILLLQFFVVFIADKTGVVVFQVASVTVDNPAIALPLISAVLLPAGYMIRNVALHMKLTLSEDYIAFAKARGLGKTYIVFYHALPNVLPYIKADLHKFLGILMSNLFVIEYLYNLHGVTMMLFSNAFGSQGYQYALVVNGLLSLLLLYGVTYAALKLYLWGWEKVIVR